MFVTAGAQAAGSFVLPNGTTLYNSGINLSGLVDLSYLMTLNPFDPGSTEARKNFPLGLPLAPQSADSAWITPSGAGTIALPPGETHAVFEVSTTLDLTGIDPATIAFEGFWVSYKQGASTTVLVNGVDTGQTNSGVWTEQPASQPGNAFLLNAASNLQAGLNTIAFRWETFDGPGAPAESYARVEFTGYSLVPLPGAVWLLAPAALLLLRARRMTG